MSYWAFYILFDGRIWYLKLVYSSRFKFLRERNRDRERMRERERVNEKENVINFLLSTVLVINDSPVAWPSSPGTWCWHAPGLSGPSGSVVACLSHSPTRSCSPSHRQPPPSTQRSPLWFTKNRQNDQI